MSTSELHDHINQSKDLLILDIREANELEICQIEGALHVPMMDIPNNLDQIPKDKPVVVMCHLGIRSAATIPYLVGKGFGNIHDLIGGIDHWALTIDPSMRRY